MKAELNICNRNRRLLAGGEISGSDVPTDARRQPGFTLIELLVVIAILGILAGLSVPALKNIGKANVNVSAARQLLDDVGRARQLAMNNHTTVYMVFVPTNFWAYSGVFQPYTAALTNLADMQLTGYNFVSFRTVGDQPGRGQTNYLSSWQTLPEGTFIAQWKFNSPYNYQTIYDVAANKNYDIYGFNRTTIPMPFPVLNSPYAVTNLPYIAFNYLGQLVSDYGQDAYIPLAHGSVSPAIDSATKAYVLNGALSVEERPSGNSTNSAYNLVHIDALTGRATLEFQKLP